MNQSNNFNQLPPSLRKIYINYIEIHSIKRSSECLECINNSKNKKPNIEKNNLYKAKINYIIN
jgi:hypothetical protein